MNNTARGVSLALLFVLLLAMQYAVRPLLDWKAEIDFLVIGLLLVSVRVRPGNAALLGCFTGLIVDALAPLSFGAGALAFTVVAFLASWLKAVFFSENIGLNAAFLFAGKWAADVCYLLVERRLQGGALTTQLLVWSPLSALVTAAVGIVLLVFLRPLVEPAERRW
jgi:rod shape-determining protein MreD